MTEEKTRPIFVVCPLCEGVGFYFYEGIISICFEDPTGLMRVECEKCNGTGEIIQPPPNPET
jgi:DnaJ-class molecular chaperone